MKLYYCSNCRRSFIKGRLERKDCEKCGKPCIEVNARRSFLHYLGFGTLLLCAILLLVFKDIDAIYRILIFILGVIGSFALVGIGNERMKKDAVRTGAKRAAEEERKGKRGRTKRKKNKAYKSG